MSRFDDAELRRRAIEGVEAEVRAMAAADPGNVLIERPGVVAGVAPVVPERSLMNSVYYSDAGALSGTLDEIATVYDDAGVRAWMVWVPEADRQTAELLAGRGHVLDSNPRAMALDLADLAPVPALPDGVERCEASQRDAARINDRAYGIESPGFETGFADPAGEPEIRWAFAAVDGEPVACTAGIPLGDDWVVSFVATLPEHRGRGIAGWLMCAQLAGAAAEGFATASLQASAAGAGIYARMGFRDFGAVEMWEHRV